MSNAKRLVLLAALALFGVWLTVHWDRVTGDADAFVRFTLGVVFAALVMMRRKDPERGRWRIPEAVFPVALIIGMLGALGGIVFRVHMIEWAGVLLLLFACCLWLARPHQRGDLALAFFILFWVHPLPGQVFGWMQGMMQRLSVMGSEIVLHALNVRVWGDGIVLRAGYQNFLVPEACSGMRTSVTVFMCALGVGLLLKLRWWETLFFVVLGLAQVLALNIARISYMVVWAPRMPPAWAENFLHDSLGIFLLGAIALVQVEAAGWRWWSRRRAFIREGIRRNEFERPDKASIIPHPLRRLGMVMLALAGVGLVGMGVLTLVYKSRAYHRKEMIREVAEGLMATNPASAHRAILEIRRHFPEDAELISMQANSDFLLGQFEAGIKVLESMEARGATLELSDRIMKAWALTRIGRVTEARALVDTLGAEEDRIPGVAMLKAEFAAMDGAPAEAARYVVIAAGSHMMLPRIRALFPYLARHEQWQAIVASDHQRPYADPRLALIALHANRQMNNMSGQMRVLEQAIASWPEDPRFLTPLFEIASRQRGGDWELRFERNFIANAPQLSVDGLAMVMDYSWRLMRPDLAWQAHHYMERRAPRDPELLMAPARHAQAWTRFRSHQLQVQADAADRTLDVAPALALLAQVAPIRDLLRYIPRLDAAAEASRRTAARRYLEEGLAELQRRENEQTLSARHLRLYPATLAMLGRFEEAHARLDRIIEIYPEREAEILYQHAVYFDQQEAWQQSYEKLMAYRELHPSPSLTASLLRMNALMNMNLGVCAMQVLDAAQQDFPGAVRLSLVEAAIWDVFGFKDQALHVLAHSAAGVRSPMALGLLYDTGRLTAAKRLETALRLGRPRASEKKDPPMWLPPATRVLTPRWPPPPEDAEIEQEIDRLQREVALATSPYIQALRGLSLSWMQALREGEYTDVPETGIADRVERWVAAGRTPLEQLGAAYELAMLAARQGDFPLAEQSLRYALERAPDNPVLWRALLAVVGDNKDLVLQAESRCPDDPEIFLAGLVMALYPGQEEEARLAAVEARVETALQRGLFSPETLVRAGDVLLSQGMSALAGQLAKAAVRDGQGLLAADVLDLRCALALGEADRAQSAALRGIAEATDPVPFYRALVDIKMARRQVDRDLLGALEFLKTAQQDEPVWAETLGALYFQRGDLRRALTIFGSVIDEDIKGVQVQTLLMAAEAARLDARHERAVRILQAAYAQAPEQVSVLNNLVYLLAQNPNTLSQAQALLPKLVELGADSFSVMDTAATVAMRSGDHEQAKIWMDQALFLIEEGAYATREVRLNVAELHMRLGEHDAAREALQSLRRDPARSDHVDQRARLLLRQLESMP